MKFFFTFLLACTFSLVAIGQAQHVSTLAGSGSQGNANGSSTVATFRFPYALAVDAQGYVYVGDRSNQLVRKVSPTGDVTTLAGSGSSGSSNGTGTQASFNNPSGVAVDAQGNVYVADLLNHRIRKISPMGVVTTVAGSGTAGNANGNGTEATFRNPTGLAIDAQGNLYVADGGNHLIRKISSTGVVTTLAGSGSAGNANGNGTAASFREPTGMAVDAQGNVYVADRPNHLIRKISPTGTVTTLAGSGTAGNDNGNGTAASFANPSGVAVDADGNVYVADQSAHLIRKISPSGDVTTLAGSGESGSDNGNATSATFNNPMGVAVDAQGNVYVADRFNHMIRKISDSCLDLPTISQNGNSLEATAVAELDYQWLNANEEIIAGATSNTFSPSQNGNYYLVVSENNCTDTTEAFTFNFTNRTNAHLATFSVYPNPASSTLKISGVAANASFSIVNLQGQVILNGSVSDEISIAHLPAGIYNLWVGNKNSKFVKL